MTPIPNLHRAGNPEPYPPSCKTTLNKYDFLRLWGHERRNRIGCQDLTPDWGMAGEEIGYLKGLKVYEPVSRCFTSREFETFPSDHWSNSKWSSNRWLFLLDRPRKSGRSRMWALNWRRLSIRWFRKRFWRLPLSWPFLLHSTISMNSKEIWRDMQEASAVIPRNSWSWRPLRRNVLEWNKRKLGNNMAGAKRFGKNFPKLLKANEPAT